MIELFAGICVGMQALALLQCSIIAHFFSEVHEDALLVLQTNYPDAVALGDITCITYEVIAAIVAQFPEHVMFCVLGGPPCQDVSKLNKRRRGALGQRSGLREQFALIYQWFLRAAGKTRVFAMMECTQMDASDRIWYDSVFRSKPYLICASEDVTLLVNQDFRPPFWWR